MRNFIVLVFALLFSVTVQAKPQIVGWSWPTTDCDGATIAQADLIAAELIYDTEPMPMPSDSAGPCSATEDPGAPATATVVAIPVTDVTRVLNLQPGVTYYFRMRVTAYVAGNWSAWSVEYVKTVPYGRPERVIMSDGKLRYSAELISDPILRLGT